MKKQILFLTAALLAGFTLGFLAGRSCSRQSPVLSGIPMEAKYDAPPFSGTVPHSEEYDITFPVNINSADIRSLAALPGIGESLAKRIIDYRAYCGPFSKPEELLNVEGIGHKTLEEILDYITTGG